jgi:hypothetical protein
MENFLFKRKIVKSAIVIATCMVIAMLLRLSLDQWQGYSKGMESLKKDDYKSAIMYFDRVMNAHIPFSPLETKAKTHLLRLAEKFEKENERELALVCYETIRTSRYLTRHIWIPDKKEIPFLNDRIATIKANLLVKDGMVKSFKEGYEQQMGIMNKDFSPSVFWSFIAVMSLFAYIGIVVLWILHRKRVYIFISGAALIIWMVSLYMA